MDAQGEERLNFIMLADREWAEMILNFCLENPVFLPYLRVASMTREAVLPHKFENMRDMLIYYVCHTGVKNSYGDTLYAQFKQEGIENIKGKKRETIEALMKLKTMFSEQELRNEVRKIKGIGPGAISFVCEQYFDSENEVEYTDRHFMKGISILMNIPPEEMNPTKALAISSKWVGKKSIGNMLCFQIAHYA